MEIKIKNSIVLKTEFLLAVERLLQSRQMPAKTCIEVNAAIDEIASHVDVLRRSRRDVALRYCSKKEDGSSQVDEKGNLVFPDIDANKACLKEFAEIGDEYLTLELTEPVTLYDDENITPIDLRLLGGMVQVKERPKT